MEEWELRKLEQEREQRQEINYRRNKKAAAELLRYFAEKKFTVGDAQRVLNLAQRVLNLAERGLTATTTVNADETAMADFLLW